MTKSPRYQDFYSREKSSPSDRPWCRTPRWQLIMKGATVLSEASESPSEHQRGSTKDLRAALRLYSSQIREVGRNSYRDLERDVIQRAVRDYGILLRIFRSCAAVLSEASESKDFREAIRPRGALKRVALSAAKGLREAIVLSPFSQNAVYDRQVLIVGA